MEGNTAKQLCAEVNERGCYLLETGHYLDCKFLVGVEPQQEVIASNKQTLAMASQVFEAMFYGDLSEKSYPIHIIDIQPETFKQLLQYIYTGIANINSADEACNLYYAAKKYMLQHLLEECSRYLWRHVDTSNVWQVFEFAELYEDKQLLLKCEKIFSMDTLEVLNTSKFEDAELNTVVTVFSYDNLNIDSETQLIKAAARYARAHNMRVTGRDLDQSPSDELLSEMSSYEPILNGEVNGVKAENSTEPVVETLNVGDAHKQLESGAQAVDTGAPAFEECSKIKRIVEKIRFLCLTAEQFAECSERTSILTMSEDYAVLMNLVSKKCKVPLPRSISTSTLARNVVDAFDNEGGETRVKGWFRYKISDFIYVEKASSPPYYVRHLAWRLNVRKDEEDRRRISVQCCGQNDPSWSCEVKMKLIILSMDVNRYNHCTLDAVHFFCKESDTFCFHGTKSIEWDRYLTQSGTVSFKLYIDDVKN